MSNDARKQSVKAYFDGIAAKDMSRVPWAKDATLRTPLNPAGGESALIRRRKAILDFFTSILPAVRRIKPLRYYTGDGGLRARPRSASRTARRFMSDSRHLCGVFAYVAHESCLSPKFPIWIVVHNMN